MRPARRAARPASTAGAHRARHRDGSCAREIALAHSTASQPSSIASAASDAVPTPASRITGTPRPLEDEAQVVGVADAHAAADRRAERHHRRAAGVLQAPREDRVVVRVGQHGEALVHQLLGRLEQLGRVGQQRAVVADHLELDPVGLERLARQLRGRDGLARRVAAGGVGQQLDAGLVEHLDDRAAGAGSTRRSATVASSVPLASIASASASSARKPPVPRMQARAEARGRRSSAARPGRLALGGLDGDRSSASLDRVEDLDALALAQLAALPLRPRHDLGVDGHGDAAARALGAERARPAAPTVVPSASSRGSPLTWTVTVMR